MKIQAIATMMTAGVVSFLQVDLPEKVSTQDGLPSTAEVSSEVGRPPAPSNWVLLGDRPEGMELYQDSVGTPLPAAPAADPSAGGFGASLEPQIVSGALHPQAMNTVEEESGAVVDLPEPGQVAPTDSANEIKLAETEVPAAGDTDAPMEGKTEEAAPATDGVDSGLVASEPGQEPIKDGAVAAALDDAELKPTLPATGDAVAGVTPGEEGGIPAPAIPFPGTGNQEETAPGGLAEKLVNQVSKAVGGASGEESAEEAGPTMGEEGNGFWLRGAKLNDVFQYLARLGNKQYFHNADLEAANYAVTGHLGDGNPIEQMKELGLMYGITVHEKGNTVYAMTSAQLAQLPTKPFYYELKYLRPSDIDQIKSILQPLLTAGSGSVDYEAKTNTLIFIDNEQKLESIKEILAELDRPKQQIAIETRILRVKSGSRNRIGVDWESVLGDGMTIEATEALNALFNLPDSDLVEQVITTTLTDTASTGFTITDRGTPDETLTLGDVTGTNLAERVDTTERTINSTESHLVLNPLQLQATLRALNSGGLAQQESSPTLITEDNEAGIISIIDRVPIITTTISETDAGQNVSEEVRYQVDINDPSATDDPTASREIGVSVAVTPTILPDNTIRMNLRPRSAQIVEFIEGRSGNLYPRVNESTVDTIARVPNGYSLLIGGFYEEQESEDVKKVPVLGDVPGVNFFFKSSDMIKEHTSLVFVVTPKLYEPVKIHEVDRVNRELHQNHVLPNDHKWPDRRNPGSNYESNLGWTLGNAVNAYPQAPPSNPLDPDHPVNLPEWDVRDEPGIRDGGTMVEVVSEPAPAPAAAPQRKGLLGNLFKKRQP